MSYFKDPTALALAASLGVLSLGVVYYLSRRRSVKVIANEKFRLGREISMNGLNKMLEGVATDGTVIAAAEDGWLVKNSQVSNATGYNPDRKKLVIVMMGFPGRGKTFISRKIARYLRWIEYRTRVFSIAKYRRDKLGNRTADFFDPSNSNAYQQRLELLLAVLEDVSRYLGRGGDVVIIDGTHTTRDRRNCIVQEMEKKRGYDVLFIESICDSEEIIMRHADEISESPDFVDSLDFAKRLAFYQEKYEKLIEEEGSFIQVYDYGRKLNLHQIHGYLQSKIVAFLMNLHTCPRRVYLLRHAESVFNVEDRIGGNPPLTQRGVKFAKSIGEYFGDEYSATDDLTVWTSTMTRAKETAIAIKGAKILEWRSLRDIDLGICDALTYDQIQTHFPDEFKARIKNKMTYRYPGGESYTDLLHRLEPVIFEMERATSPLVIVAHQAVLRCLYAYFLDFPHEELPFLAIPLHTLICLEPAAYGCKEKRMKFILEGDPPTK